MSDIKNDVFSEGDVIRLVHKPKPETSSIDLSSSAPGFEGVLEKVREEAARQAAAAVHSSLSPYQHKMLISTIDNIEFQLGKLRKQLSSTLVRKPWYTKLMFWRKN